MSYFSRDRRSFGAGWCVQNYIVSSANMAQKLDQSETVGLKELLLSEVIQSEALINLLDRKGIVSKQELLEEIKRVNAKRLKSEA